MIEEPRAASSAAARSVTQHLPLDPLAPRPGRHCRRQRAGELGHADALDGREVASRHGAVHAGVQIAAGLGDITPRAGTPSGRGEERRPRIARETELKTGEEVRETDTE